MPQRTPQIFSTILAVLVLWIFFSQPEETPQSSPVETAQATPVSSPPIIQAQTGREAGYISSSAASRQIIATPTLVDRNYSIPRILEEEALITEDSSLPPGLLDFAAKVFNGKKDVVRGVFVQGVLELPVVQQPPKEAAYVSEELGVATQFQSAAHFGVIGLLAHNYLSGQLFYNLEVGQIVYIILGDGKIQRYVVDEIARYKKLDTSSLRSDLVDQSDGKTYTTPQVFKRFYRQPHKVTFQTCLEGEGRLNWGLIFITATPFEK